MSRRIAIVADDFPYPIGPEATASSDALAAFLRTASLEVTQPTAAEIERIASVLPAGTEIFVSDVPRRPAEEPAETTGQAA